MVGRSVPVMDRAVSTTFYNLLLTWAFELPNLAMMQPVKCTGPPPIYWHPWIQSLSGLSFLPDKKRSWSGGEFNGTGTVHLGCRWAEISARKVGRGSGQMERICRLWPTGGKFIPPIGTGPNEVKISRLTRPGYHIFGGVLGTFQ